MEWSGGGGGDGGVDYFSDLNGEWSFSRNQEYERDGEVHL